MSTAKIATAIEVIFEAIPEHGQSLDELEKVVRESCMKQFGTEPMMCERLENSIKIGYWHEKCI